jgi:WD40 repeat protein
VAEKVLEELIDARLLTSYEVEGREGEPSHHRIEIAHESLLKAWPRLVRWQTQDEDGALLRDQLKQAAHLWEERERSADLLWTGMAFREFELWRDRYPGQLTALEHEFARAMTEKALRRKRLVRASALVAVALSTGVAIAIGVSRHQAVRARERAEEEARRAEASKIVALGRNELDRYPTAALAYARRSLEIADNAAARWLVVEALWRGPTARILPIDFGGTWGAGFSPDGRRLAARTFSENLLLYAEDGSPPRAFGGLKPPIGPSNVFFTPDGAAIATSLGDDVRVLSTADGREIHALRPGLPGGRPGSLRDLAFLPEGVLFQVAEKDTPDAVVRLGVWPYDGGAPRFLGAHRGGIGLSVDSRGTRLVFGRFDRGPRLFVRALAGPGGTAERDVGLSPEGRITGWRMSSDGTRLAVSEDSGRLTVWDLDSPAAAKPRVLRFANPDPESCPSFDSSGSLVSWGSSSEKQVALWDLSAPPAAAPRLLRRSDVPLTKATFFHPRGDWLAALNYATAAFWSIRQPWPRVMRGRTGRVFGLAFTADSRHLLSCAFDGIHLWPLDPADGAGQRRISKEAICYGMTLSPDGREVLWGAAGAQRTPLSGGGDAWLLPPGQPFDEVTPAMVIDGSGHRAATATGYSRPPARQRLRLWEWPSGRLLRDLPYAPPGEPDDSKALNAGSLVFAPDGRVIGAGQGGIVRFDPETGAREWIRKVPSKGYALFVVADDPGLLLFAEADVFTSDSTLSRLGLFRLEGGDVRWITSHGARITAIAIDRAGRTLVTGDDQGAVRVGRADGGEPHLLLGHGGSVEAVALSPDGRWVASASGSEIRLWPMPDLAKPPLHTLPYDELMAKLRALTNLQVVEDKAPPTGYKLDVGPFPGWKDVPTW